MSPAAKGQALLYVTNAGTGDVTVYGYNYGKNPMLVGTLTGFTALSAPCSDAKGDVFIPDQEFETLTKHQVWARLS